MRVWVGTTNLDLVKEFGADIFNYDLKGEAGIERMNMRWLLVLLQKSVSPNPSAIVERPFRELDIEQQGGPVYLKLIQDVVFTMIEPVIVALEAHLTTFSKKGLWEIPNENVTNLEIKMLAMCVRLSEINCLPPDTDKLILKGLIKSSQDGFWKSFELVRDLQTQTMYAMSGTSGARDFI